MYNFSQRSLVNLRGIDPQLVTLMLEVLKTIDISITSGLRSQQQQQDLHAKGRSQLDGITRKSKHQLGRAVDFVAYGNRPSFNGRDNAYIAGFIHATAIRLNRPVRLGARWDRKPCSETSLFDPYHVKKKKKRGWGS